MFAGAVTYAICSPLMAAGIMNSFINPHLNDGCAAR